MPHTLKLRDDTLHYYIDVAAVRDGAVVLRGWAFLDAGVLVSVFLDVRDAKGRLQQYSVRYGDRRPDVASLYPGVAGAASSGFVVHERLTAAPAGEVSLRFEVAGGETRAVSIPLIHHLHRPSLRRRAMMLQRLAGKACRLLQRGSVVRLWQAIREYWLRYPRQVSDLTATVQRMLATNEVAQASLIIDHDLGGGANQYRERLIAPLLASGESVLILTFYLATLSLVIEYRDAQRSRRFAADGVERVTALAEAGLLRDVTFNNAVSFSEPLGIASLLVELRERFAIPFRFYVHDSFVACPSHLLLDDRGYYCGLPYEDVCERCLKRNQQSFVQLLSISDIGGWRAAWRRCLEAADVIVCFSESSATTLRRAFPDLSSSRLTVRPHVLDYFRASTPRLNMNAGLHIGVVGHVGYAKGGAVVSELAREIARRGLDIPVTVFGTLDAEFATATIRETGSYTQDSLGTLIEQSGANVFLFPSLCPETFSFVTAELISMRLPVVCFNLGAQAERVAGYRWGRVLPYPPAPAATLLDELLTFHQSVAANYRADADGVAK